LRAVVEQRTAHGDLAPRRYQLIYQLRIYEIFDRNKAAFHARFRDHAVRINRKYGFNFVGMWEAQTPQRTEFVYLLAWPDEDTKNAAWEKFRADEEWKKIRDETRAVHGDLVGEIEDRTLVLTDYSPAPPLQTLRGEQLGRR
jgi:NIPSNAP